METALYKPEKQTGSAMEIATTRAAQEVQAAMVIAKRFPRDHEAAYTRIIQACCRKSLAEQAAYVYARGGQEITGPSIRLAECLAQNWGNIEFGITELEQRNGESSVMAFAWDLESNSRQVKVFTVPHVRYSKNKGNAELTDPRDIYELVANNGARRLRACILGVIPGDIVDAALTQCEKTMKEGNKEPLSDRVRKMLVAFSEQGVSQAMIEAKLQHNANTINETEFAKLKKIFVSIRDGFGSREEYFPAVITGQDVKHDVSVVGETPTPPTPQPEQFADGMTLRDKVVAIALENEVTPEQIRKICTGINPYSNDGKTLTNEAVAALVNKWDVK